MSLVSRVLDRQPVLSLGDHLDAGGGEGLRLARQVGADVVTGVIGDAGLRGRGGAGFPTGVKWRTVAEARSPETPTSVVVNAAEGEPGTFKDRALLRTNPYRVLEGATIAALAVGAGRIRIGIKASFEREIQRLVEAITECEAAGWFEGLDVALVLGPSSYLFGEETAMLEVVEGRQPFPRVTPPFRRGVDDEERARSAGGVDLAAPGGSAEPPALVDNVETLAHVPLIVAHGAEWFRELGTPESPGSIVCTVSGATRRDGVAELAMGTTLREAIELIGWGPVEGHRIETVISGTANPLIPASMLDTPLTYEAMRDAGSGLGSAGFVVFDETTDPVSIAQGVSRFLAVESCGQCEPCKTDGLAIAGLLDTARGSTIDDAGLDELHRRVNTVSVGARCNLALQQEDVVGSLLRLHGGTLEQRVLGEPDSLPPAAPVLVAPVVDLVGGRAVLEERQRAKQPDWTYDDIDSGTSPAELLGDTPVFISSPTPSPRTEGWSISADEEERSPLELVDEAHEVLDRLLVEARGAAPDRRADAIGKLAHIARVHVDVTRRVLYPLARRHGDDGAEALANRSEQGEGPILALAQRLDDPGLDESGRDELLLQLGEELQQHANDEERLLQELAPAMTDAERLTLAEGMAEARLTSLAR